VSAKEYGYLVIVDNLFGPNLAKRMTVNPTLLFDVGLIMMIIVIFATRQNCFNTKIYL
jgi:hypothetical protein